MTVSLDYFDDMGDTYTTSSSAQLMGWTVGTLNIVSGRVAGGCFQIGNNQSVSRTFASGSQRYFGFAWKEQVGTTACTLAQFYQGANRQVILTYQGDGTFRFFNGAGTGNTVLGTSDFRAIGSDEWHFVEVNITIHDSAGAITMWLDGEQVFDDNSLDTTGAGTDALDRIILSGPSASFQSAYYDDFVSGTGSGNLGDVRVIGQLPDDDGDSSDFTGSDSDSVDNYQLVDDSNPDGDSTYVHSGTDGHTDLYTYPALPVGSGAVVYAVGVRPIARKDDAGDRYLARAIKSGSTTDVDTESVLSTSYSAKLGIWDQDPDTSSAWDVSGVDSAQYGQRIVVP